MESVEQVNFRKVVKGADSIDEIKMIPVEEVEIKSRDSVVDQLSSGNPVVRMQAFAELLKNPTEDNIASAIKAYNKLAEGPSRFSELRLLTFSWAQVNPHGAMKWVQSLDGFEQRIGTGSIMDSWARKILMKQLHGQSRILMVEKVVKILILSVLLVEWQKMI